MKTAQNREQRAMTMTHLGLLARNVLPLIRTLTTQSTLRTPSFIHFGKALILGVAVLLLLGAPALRAQTMVTLTNTNGGWGTNNSSTNFFDGTSAFNNTNWSSAVLASNLAAVFTNNSGSFAVNTTVYLNALYYNPGAASSSFRIGTNAGNGTLSFTGTSATIGLTNANAGSSTLTINSALTLADNLSITNNGFLTLATNISGSSGTATLTFSGTGTTTLTGSNNIYQSLIRSGWVNFSSQYSAGTNTLNTNSDTARSLVVNGGAANFGSGSSITLGSFNIAASANTTAIMYVSNGTKINSQRSGVEGAINNSTNQLIISNGTINASANLYASTKGTGSVGLITNGGGTITAVNLILSGNSTSTSAQSTNTYVQTGSGSLSVSGSVYVGVWGSLSNMVNIYSIQGGTVSVGGNIYLNGHFGGSNAVISNQYNVFSNTGGNVTATKLTFGYNAAANNIPTSYTSLSNITNLVVLGGGTTTVQNITVFDNFTNIPTGYTNQLIWNGGVLKAGASSTSTFWTNLTSTTVTISNNGGIFDIGGFINTIGQNLSGNGTLTVTNSSSANTLTLSGSNSYGGLIINGDNATVSQGSATALGTNTGTLTLALGTLNIGTNNDTFAMVNFGNGTLTGSGTLTATTAYNVTNTKALTITNVLAGNGSLTQSGTGTTTLSVSNSYQGGTILNAGRLALSNSFALGTGALNFASNSTLAALANLNVTNAYSISGSQTATIDVGTGLTLTNAGIVSGTGALIKTNTGNLILSGVNTFSGGVTIAQGTVTVGNNSGLGSTSNDVSLGGILNLNASTVAIDALTGSGTVNNTNASASTLSLGNNNGSGTFTGVITNVIALTKIGTGTQTLTGSNSFTGGTTINAGTLVVSNAFALASNAVTVNGGTLSLASNVFATTFAIGNGTLAGAGTLSASSGFTATNTVDLTLSNSLAGAGSFTQSGTGTTTISASNSFQGGTVVAAGSSLVINDANALGGGTVTMNSQSGGNSATLTFGNSLSGKTFANSLKASGVGQTSIIKNASSGTVTLSGSLDKTGSILLFNQGSFNVTGVISGTTNTFNSDLVVSNASVTLSTTNTYFGPTYVQGGSTLTMGTNNALPTNTVVYLGGSSDASDNALNLAGYSIQIAGLSSSGTGLNSVLNSGGSASTLTILSSSNNTFAGNIGGTSSNNNINLIVSGSSQTLTGTNPYTGTTLVTNNGTLNLTGGGKLSGTTSVTIASGSSLLLGNTGATNSVNAAATVTLGGGTLSMGGSGGGTRTASQNFGTLTLTANSVIDFANLGGNSKLTFNGINMGTYTLTIYNWSGTNQWGTQSQTQLGTTTQLFDTGGFTGSLSNISFWSGGVGSTFLGNGVFNGQEIVPVPEPSVVISGVLLLGFLIFANRGTLIALARRRRAQT